MIYMLSQQTTTPRAAQERASFSEAFYLCTQCHESMDTLQQLSVAAQLRDTIQAQSRQLMTRMEASLTAVCTDFDAEAYAKVLDGYMCVDMVPQLSDAVKTAFSSAAGAAVGKVVRGVLLARVVGGEEEAALTGGSTESLPDLLKRLPKDLFRTALANVLMVTFDVMASHHRMASWHREALERHAVELSRIQRYKHDVRVRLGGESPASPRTPSRGGWEALMVLEAPLEAQYEVWVCVGVDV